MLAEHGGEAAIRPTPDGVRVFLNGALVHEHRGRRPLVLDEDQVEVPMLAGENAILVKVDATAFELGPDGRTTGFVASLSNQEPRGRRVEESPGWVAGAGTAGGWRST